MADDSVKIIVARLPAKGLLNGLIVRDKFGRVASSSLGKDTIDPHIRDTINGIQYLKYRIAVAVTAVQPIPSYSPGRV